MTRVIRILSLSSVLMACGGSEPSGGDPDRGPIEDILSFEERVSWPGMDQASGRVLLSLRGFSNGEQIGYWFLGFGARRTDDAFFFCREGDEACPLDQHQRLNWDRLVGHPIFTRIPGDPEFSPFWQMWVVRVPEDFEPDSVKTIETLDRLAQAGEVSADRFILDFDRIFEEYVGPREVVLHCALVLAGTELSENGLTLVDGKLDILRLQRQLGWFEGRRVEFVDFSFSEGVFPAANDSDSRAETRVANVYIMWRSCDVEPRPAICDVPGYANPTMRPVSERGLGQDVTGNGDPFDTNNVFGATRCRRTSPLEIPYSPLWGPQAVTVAPERALVDTYGDLARSEVQSSEDISDAVAQGEAPPPTVMMEDETGNPVPGNEGRVLFDCPFSVAEDFVPYPCEANE
ncbi:MAG: hypothetical protein HYY06_13325 [Deltaproteobacteria bacterium]|nr:hypothetical protein [Deltaproteobacteria bacterium]